MQRSKLLYSLPLLLFFCLVLFLWRGLGIDSRLLPSALLNKPLPDFELADLRQPEHLIKKQAWLGNIAVVNVWATWCPSCYQEHGFLMRLAHQSVVIYGINYKDERAGAMQWLKSYGNPYESVVFDQAGRLGLDMGVYGAPETFLIDAQGIIRYRHAGPLNEAVWQDVFLPRINQLKAPAV